MKDTWKYFAACLVGFAIAGWAGQIAAVGFVSFLGNWQTLIAGTAALVGALLTIRAMRADPIEAKAVVLSFLTSKLAMIDVIWEFVDTALTDAEARDDAILHVGFANTELKFEEWAQELVELKAHLSPRFRMHLEAIIGEFQSAQRIVEQPRPTRDNTAEDQIERLTEVWLQIYRIAFSRIRRVAIKFDPELAASFDGRTISKLDETTTAEALRDSFRKKLERLRKDAEHR